METNLIAFQILVVLFFVAITILFFAFCFFVWYIRYYDKKKFEFERAKALQILLVCILVRCIVSDSGHVAGNHYISAKNKYGVRFVTDQYGDLVVMDKNKFVFIKRLPCTFEND